MAIAELSDGRRLTLSSESRPLRDLALQRQIVSRKFLSLTEPILGSDGAEELQQHILEIDKADSVQSALTLSVARMFSGSGAPGGQA